MISCLYATPLPADDSPGSHSCLRLNVQSPCLDKVSPLTAATNSPAATQARGPHKRADSGQAQVLCSLRNHDDTMILSIMRDLEFRTSYLAVDHLYILATDICELALQHVPSQSSKEDKWSRVLGEDTPLSHAIRELMADAPLHGMDIPPAVNIVIRDTRNGEQAEDNANEHDKRRHVTWHVRWPYVDLCTEAGHSGGWAAAEKRMQGLKDAGVLNGNIQENNQLVAWIVSHFQGFKALDVMSSS